ncbi:MAG TPA: hypothetical protein VMU00_08520 [Steroidobacteraceae bacterium]|nr:hypothetical protein [Steroidobacteraceae bacterium]
MRAARHWSVRLVVTLDEPRTARAEIELRLACWLERVAALIARRDTPCAAGPAARAAPAEPPR